MVRLARVVAPGIPHHITQRGNRRQETFFCAEDYQAYTALMGAWCRACAVEVWVYCLMPNHVHSIAVPDSEDGLRRAIGEAHRRYTRRVNFREGWRGHLWQGRFASCPMDEPYLLTAARYIEQNPIRAGLAARPREYPWSSARAHVAGRDDTLVKATPLLTLVGNREAFLSLETSTEEIRRLRRYYAVRNTGYTRTAALLRAWGRPSPLQGELARARPSPRAPTERGGPPPLVGLSPGLCGQGWFRV